MNLTKAQSWERFKKYYFEFPHLGLSLDISRMNFEEDIFKKMSPKMEKAFAAMAALEKGAIANPDEHRMVGHYWLRNPDLSPSTEIRDAIKSTIKAVRHFASQVHVGKLRGTKGTFKNLLLIGIGGSALGPQFVSHALGHPKTDKLRFYSLDNTDPDGIARVFSQIDDDIGRTLCVVISKSGGTKETRNGMLEARVAYEKAGLNFGRHAVAVTGLGSELDKYAEANGWLARFPMWDWVGGRTSIFSAVGLLPAALQGIDIEAFLSGGKACDVATRTARIFENPAALNALMWFASGNGKGEKNMVVLPYKDSLELFSKYLQQLIMESIGKEKRLDGKIANQGITVLGNKGSTDQHSYVQQLRDGLNNFFATFIEVLGEDPLRKNIFVEPKITTGDYLHSFLLGTRQALSANNRDSMTITINAISPFSIGVLVALFERTVGLYASLININPYNQPGVEAGKKAAAAIINAELAILEALTRINQPVGVDEITKKIGAEYDQETVFKICERLLRLPERKMKKTIVKTAFTAKYSIK